MTSGVTYMSLTTMLMWALAGGGALIELVVQLNPWALGLTDTVDPIVARTLFWWTGHPIVYFWLMPAYVSWYGLLSKQIGGKLVSDPMARLTFALLLVFSLPVGSHHQFTDPSQAETARRKSGETCQLVAHDRHRCANLWRVVDPGANPHRPRRGRGARSMRRCEHTLLARLSIAWLIERLRTRSRWGQTC